MLHDVAIRFFHQKVQAKNWLEIRYVIIDKAYFYGDTNENSIKKAYILKGDIVFIDQYKDGWIHCEYHGKAITKGWIKLNAINKN
jgi:hypothetical protein